MRILDAWLDTQLKYRFDSKGVNELRGTVGLRNLQVRMPNIEEPAVEYKLLHVRMDPIDLVARKARISEVTMRATVGKGSVQVDAALRLAQLGFAGTVRAVEFPLPEMLAAAAVRPTDILTGSGTGIGFDGGGGLGDHSGCGRRACT